MFVHLWAFFAFYNLKKSKNQLHWELINKGGYTFIFGKGKIIRLDIDQELEDLGCRSTDRYIRPFGRN